MFSSPCLMGRHWPLHLFICCEQAVNTFRLRTGAVISCKECLYEKRRSCFCFALKEQNSYFCSDAKYTCMCVSVSVHLEMYQVRSINCWLKCLRSFGRCLRYRNARWRFNSQEQSETKTDFTEKEKCETPEFPVHHPVLQVRYWSLKHVCVCVWVSPYRRLRAIMYSRVNLRKW